MISISNYVPTTLVLIVLVTVPTSGVVQNTSLDPYSSSLHRSKRSGGGHVSSVYPEIVCIRTIARTPKSGPDGLIFGVAILLNQKWALVHNQVLDESSADSKAHQLHKIRSRIFYVPSFPYMMDFTWPAPPIVNVKFLPKAHETKFMEYNRMLNLGEISLIKFASKPEYFTHERTPMVGENELISEGCTMYSYSWTPSNAEYDGVGGDRKFWVSHKVFKIEPSCNDDHCLFSTSDGSRLCGRLTDLGAPIYCDGDLAYMVSKVDQYRYCEFRFEATSLARHSGKIQSIIKEKGMSN